MSVRIVIVGSSGISPDPDGLHSVEEDTIHRVMTQCSLFAIFVCQDSACHRIDDVESVESPYPHFARRRFFDTTDIVIR